MEKNNDVVILYASWMRMSFFDKLFYWILVFISIIWSYDGEDRPDAEKAFFKGHVVLLLILTLFA
jgi:hypothetical protein